MKKKVISDHWKVKFKARKKPSVQPGIVASDKVKLVEVGISELETDHQKTTNIDFSLEKESKARMEIVLNTTTPSAQGNQLAAAGTEKTLSVDLDEDFADDTHTSTLRMRTHQGEETMHTVQLKHTKKRRFKAGTDLTEKVNKVAVDIIEELVDDVELCEIVVEVSDAGETSELDADI